MKSTIQLLTVILVSQSTIIHSKSHGVDVYDNIQNCPKNKSGPECDIPYQTCEDNERLCFNNSKCTKSKTKDPVTNDYPYICDCAYASTRQSKFAGMECEHSDTMLCTNVKSGYGSTFCTNGGQCMEMTHHGEIRGGCACPLDFVGAHCQYLKNDIEGGIAGEALFTDVADNFWAFVPEKTSRSKATAVAIGVSVSAICMITLAFFFALKRFRNKRDREIDDHGTNISSMDNNLDADSVGAGVSIGTGTGAGNLDADGSGTMKVNEVI